jgi:hypothetical protein
MESPVVIRLHNPHAYDALFRLVVHWGSLPDDAELHVAVGHTRDEGKIDPPFPDEIDGGCDGPIRLKTFRTYHLKATSERRTVLPEIFIERRRPAIVALMVKAGQAADGRPSRFDLVQMDGQRVIGGSTFVVRTTNDSRSNTLT